MNEHLTPEELLLALKHCMGQEGGDSCISCPNAIPGTEDKDGFCKCRFNIHTESIRILESFINNKK